MPLPLPLAAAAAGGLICTGWIMAVFWWYRINPLPQIAKPDSRMHAVLAEIRRPATARQAAAAVVTGPAVIAVTGWPVAAAAAVAACFALPRIAGARTAKARIARLEALEAWTRRLADVLAASRGLEDALIGSARHAPDAISVEVGDLVRRIRMRMPTPQALRMFADDLDDPVADLLAAALIRAAAKRSGVTAILTELAAVVSRDVTNRLEVESERRRHRTAVKAITVMLIGFGCLALARPDYVAPYGTTQGQLMLAVVAGLFGTALTWLHRLGNARPPGRFL